MYAVKVDADYKCFGCGKEETTTTACPMWQKTLDVPQDEWSTKSDTVWEVDPTNCSLPEGWFKTFYGYKIWCPKCIAEGKHKE